MSEIVIVLLLLVPVFLVVAILNRSHKKQKKKAQDRLSDYLNERTEELGMKHSFRKQLVHQLVIIDDIARKILVVSGRDQFSHELYSLDFIKTLRVVNQKQSFIVDEKSKKSETITTQVGVEIAFEKPQKEIFLTLYDHVEHNIFQMADLEKEAWQLHERITKAKIHQLINA